MPDLGERRNALRFSALRLLRYDIVSTTFALATAAGRNAKPCSLYIAGPYLISFAQEMAWREDHRKDPSALRSTEV
jgi:hypothetical protein